MSIVPPESLFNVMIYELTTEELDAQITSVTISAKEI